MITETVLVQGGVRFGTPDEAALPSAIDITDRVRVVLDLLPEPRVVAVYVAARSGDVTEEERRLAGHLFDSEVAYALGRLLEAEFAARKFSAPRWWDLEWSLRAADAVALVSRESVEGTASGLANTAASARLAAAVTLEDLLTTDARRAGGNGLRVPVMSIRATLSTGPGAASEILDRLQSDWPVASCDLPDPNDTTMAELYDSMEVRSAKRPVLVFAGGEGIGLLSETESDVDISELVDAGLVEMGTTARAQRVGGPDVPGWILRIAVRPDVAVALRKLWRVWDSARVKGGIPDAEALLLAYAGLTILTPLSFTYEAMVKAAGQKGAASPHLVDVVCTVHAGDRSASLAFFETETDSEDGAVDLMATLPLQVLPGKWNTDIEIRGGRRSPIVEGRSDPVARLFELRSFWRQGALSITATRRANDLYKKLMKQLDGPAAAALTGERAAALERRGAGLKKDVHDTIAKMTEVETELVRSLGAAVAGVNAVPDPTTLEEIRRMVASLWKIRLFLKGAPEG